MDNLIAAIVKSFHTPPPITWDTIAVIAVFLAVWEVVWFIMRMPDDPEKGEW
jgi:hypothetical protein